MIIGQLHHGIVVADIEKAIVWYRDVLGLELIHRQRQENEYTPLLVGVTAAVLDVAQLKIPTTLPTLSTHDIELIEYVHAGVVGAPSPVNQVGSAHLAFLVSDIQALYEKVRAAEGKFRNPPIHITHGTNQGGQACYLHDPDGNTLEFIQPAPERLSGMIQKLQAFQPKEGTTDAESREG